MSSSRFMKRTAYLKFEHNQRALRAGVRLNVSITKSAAPKAAEGQPQSKTCRNLRGARSRAASWTAAVLLPLLSRRLSATDSFKHTRMSRSSYYSIVLLLLFLSQSKTCRNLHGARSREASWPAAVLLVLLPLCLEGFQRP